MASSVSREEAVMAEVGGMLSKRKIEYQYTMEKGPVIYLSVCRPPYIQAGAHTMMEPRNVIFMQCPSPDTFFVSADLVSRNRVDLTKRPTRDSVSGITFRLTLRNLSGENTYCVAMPSPFLSSADAYYGTVFESLSAAVDSLFLPPALPGFSLRSSLERISNINARASRKQDTDALLLNVQMPEFMSRLIGILLAVRQLPPTTDRYDKKKIREYIAGLREPGIELIDQEVAIDSFVEDLLIKTQQCEGHLLSEEIRSALSMPQNAYVLYAIASGYSI